jgi:hypothetical protein
VFDKLAVDAEEMEIRFCRRLRAENPLDLGVNYRKMRFHRGMPGVQAG